MFHGVGETETLGIKQLLLAGARLKNTKYIIGMAVYTGADAKAVLNEPKASFKFSIIERRLNHFLYIYFTFLLIVSVQEARLRINALHKQL